jgi:hypothetical protein
MKTFMHDPDRLVQAPRPSDWPFAFLVFALSLCAFSGGFLVGMLYATL